MQGSATSPVNRPLRQLLRRGAMLLGLCALVGVGAWRVLEHRVAVRCDDWVESGRRELHGGSPLLALDGLGRALREPRCGLERDARLWFDHAMARIRVRDFDLAHVKAAIASLQAARRLDPADAEIGTALAEAWLGVGAHDEAVAVAQRVLAGGAHGPARRVLAGALLAAGRERELRDHLDGDGWTREGFWYRATRLLLAEPDALTRAAVGARVLGEEDDPQAGLLLAVLAGRPHAPDPEALVAQLIEADTAPADDVIGTALLLLEQRERPDLMLSLLEHHAQLLDGAAGTRLLALAWQADRPQLLRDALDARVPSIHEDPERVLYGALAGHEASIAALRAEPDRDTAVARAWRALGRAVLDAAAPGNLADAAGEVLRDAPRSALVLTLAGEAWLRLGEFRRAERLALRAMRLEPFWAQPRLLRGIVLARRGTPEGGEASALPAPPPEPLEARPASAAAFRAGAAARLGADAKPWQVLLLAIADARRSGMLAAADMLVAELAAESASGATLWRLERARILLAAPREEEELARAALRLREVLEVLPNHAEARLLMGLARARLRDPVGARTQLLAAVTLEPDLWREALRLAVLAYREAAGADAAALVELAARIVARAPLSDSARRATEEAWLRGLVTATAGGRDPRLERAAYARLVEVAPALGFALNNHAWLLFEAREALPTALVLAQRAVALRPDEPAYADTLAAIGGWQDAERAEAAAQRARIEAALEAYRARQRAARTHEGAAVPAQARSARNSSVELVRG